MTNKSQWAVKAVNTAFDSQIWEKLNLKTKPPGSLGKIEQLAFQIARVQGSLAPSLNEPVVLIFAGDHGIAKSGLVNPYPQEVTHQMALNFLAEGAAINAMARVAGMEVTVIDSGVTHDFTASLPMIHSKIGYGTADYRNGPAMSLEACHQALQKGSEIAGDVILKGTNVIGFGEMGIGNTSAASLIISTLSNISLEECVGKGTGASGDLLKQKLTTLKEVHAFHRLSSTADPEQILTTYGGFEIAQMVGGMLEAASRKCILLVDGFISTAAFLVAFKIAPEIIEYAVFTHQSEELGHTKVLSYLKVKPLLDLQMRLGEGTGCAASFPLLKMAVAILNEMASFESAGVSDKSN